MGKVKFFKEKQVARQRGTLSLGKPLTSHRKLLPITSMRPVGSSETDKAVRSSNTDDWTSWLTSEYREKWGCDAIQALQASATLLSDHDGLSFGFSADECERATTFIRKMFRNDVNGVCIASLWCLQSRQPSFFRSFLNAVAETQSSLEFFIFPASSEPKKKAQ